MDFTVLVSCFLRRRYHGWQHLFSNVFLLNGDPKLILAQNPGVRLDRLCAENPHSVWSSPFILLLEAASVLLFACMYFQGWLIGIRVKLEMLCIILSPPSLSGWMDITSDVVQGLTRPGLVTWTFECCWSFCCMLLICECCHVKILWNIRAHIIMKAFFHHLRLLAYCQTECI